MLLLIFDWGGTVMVDYEENGPMYQWDKVDYVYGIEKALVELSREYKCCIATNADYSGRDELIMALKRVGADKYFNNFFTSIDLGYEKPDKRFFLSIAKEMEVMPVDCIMIGNNYHKDIVGAKETGMKTIFYNEDDQIEDFSAADIIISSMAELLNAINRITG